MALKGSEVDGTMGGKPPRRWLMPTLYVVASVLFAAVMLAFGRNTVFDSWRLMRNINRSEHQSEVYARQISEDSLFLESLNDPAVVEKLSRERFFLKRHDEQIYLVE